MPSNPSDLRAVGDQMQSTLSRLAAYVEGIHTAALTEGATIPYETRMAVAEAKSAINDWTMLRVLDATAHRPQPCQSEYALIPCELDAGHEGMHEGMAEGDSNTIRWGD